MEYTNPSIFTNFYFYSTKETVRKQVSNIKTRKVSFLCVLQLFKMYQLWGAIDDEHRKIILFACSFFFCSKSDLCLSILFFCVTHTKKPYKIYWHLYGKNERIFMFCKKLNTLSQMAQLRCDFNYEIKQSPTQ